MLKDGPVFDNLPPPTKDSLRRGSATTLLLWSKEVSWYKPMATQCLPTTPGINVIDVAAKGWPADILIRYWVLYAIQLTRRGAHFASGDQVEDYLQSPTPVYLAAPPFPFPVNSSPEPVFSRPSGRASTITTSTQPVSLKLRGPKKRDGLVLDLSRRQQKSLNVMKETAPPKYSPRPHPFFMLRESALPPQSSSEVIEQARSSFSCSLARSTQAKYATAVRHYKQAQVDLGTTFSVPMTDVERAYFTVYLASRGLDKGTIQNYLTGLRFYEMAKGSPTPSSNTDLVKQLIAGSANMKRDPVLASSKKERRPITGKMLSLLSHSIASSSVWNDYEQLLRWTVVKLAFWGSFRISELCCEYKDQFHSSFSLMPADITFHDKSVVIWLCGPKVASRLGDLVEVWAVEDSPAMDPVQSLKVFLDLRSSIFGASGDNLPVFIHENGSALSKAEFNSDLKVMLDMFPELSTSNRDLFAGHSFRSGNLLVLLRLLGLILIIIGLSTLLQSLGFSEGEIKSWGR